MTDVPSLVPRLRLRSSTGSDLASREGVDGFVSFIGVSTLGLISVTSDFTTGGAFSFVSSFSAKRISSSSNAACSNGVKGFVGLVSSFIGSFDSRFSSFSWFTEDSSSLGRDSSLFSSGKNGSASSLCSTSGSAGVGSTPSTSAPSSFESFIGSSWISRASSPWSSVASSMASSLSFLISPSSTTVSAFSSSCFTSSVSSFSIFSS
mmetsp:Transcript_26355/g.47606  ORF Transcript_26355/g.47606 Transcript_26355/m.47606 type:complete len:206 (-) Transcript_26355:565-1182(-)